MVPLEKGCRLGPQIDRDGWRTKHAIPGPSPFLGGFGSGFRAFTGIHRVNNLVVICEVGGGVDADPRARKIPLRGTGPEQDKGEWHGIKIDTNIPHVGGG